MVKISAVYSPPKERKNLFWPRLVPCLHVFCCVFDTAEFGQAKEKKFFCWAGQPIVAAGV
jgi:hypothetical protein